MVTKWRFLMFYRRYLIPQLLGAFRFVTANEVSMVARSHMSRYGRWQHHLPTLSSVGYADVFTHHELGSLLHNEYEMDNGCILIRCLYIFIPIVPTDINTFATIHVTRRHLKFHVPLKFLPSSIFTCYWCEFRVAMFPLRIKFGIFLDTFRSPDS